MILTPTNRYGFAGYYFKRIWPKLFYFTRKGKRKYRGIEVETLGGDSKQHFIAGNGLETLQ
jgi:hypothetical protein